MDDREILLQEYNNLWNEKLIHKQSIRKFHSYLTYITAVGSLALVVNGLSINDIFKIGSDPVLTNHILQNTRSIVHLFFIAFTPVVMLTLIFPLNDIYHIYVMAHQVKELEKIINEKSGLENLLTWEHVVCPVVYGGERVAIGKHKTKLTNTIFLGDILLLVPAIAILCAVSTITSSTYILEEVGLVYSIGYVMLIVYMATVVVILALKIKNYTKANGLISVLVSEKRKSVKA